MMREEERPTIIWGPLARKEDRSRIDWASLALVLPPTLVFLLSDWLVARFGWYGLGPMPAVVPLPHGHTDAAGRLYILAALLAVCVATFLTVLLFARDVAEEFGPRMRRVLFATIASGLAIGALWVWLYSLPQLALEAPLGTDVIDSAARLYERLTQGGRGANVTASTLESMILLARIVLMLGAVLVVVGAVSCLASPLESATIEEKRAFLERQHLRFRLYINAVAALMVTAIAFQLAWTRWPQALLKEPAAKAFSAHVDAFALYSGISLSLVIASFAIPVAAVLHERASAMTIGDPETAKLPELFGAGLMQGLGKVLVILAPAVAGIIPTLAEILQPR